MTPEEKLLQANQHAWIIDKGGFEPIECSCNKCKKMCTVAPCIGTPLDMLAIAEAGYANRIRYTSQGSWTKYGFPMYEIVMPEFLVEGNKTRCTFLTEEGLCELHEKGLKPIEGKLANCTAEVIPADKYPVGLLCSSLYEEEFSRETIFKLDLLMIASNL